MITKKTSHNIITGNDKDDDLPIFTRLFLARMAEKYKIRSDKLTINMQGDQIVIQSYDLSDSPVWKTLEIITFNI